jgi:hypothetical protein
VFFKKGINKKNKKLSKVEKCSRKLFITRPGTFPLPPGHLLMIVLIHLISAHHLNFPPMSGSVRHTLSDPFFLPSREDSTRAKRPSLNKIDIINEAG